MRVDELADVQIRNDRPFQQSDESDLVYGQDGDEHADHQSRERPDYAPARFLEMIEERHFTSGIRLRHPRRPRPRNLVLERYRMVRSRSRASSASVLWGYSRTMRCSAA